MIGEGMIDNSVWLIKSHFPERAGHSQLRINKCVIIVRSPIDCIASLFNMIATGSHSKSIQKDHYEMVPELWDKFIN